MNIQVLFSIFFFGCLAIALVFCHKLSNSENYSITEECKHPNVITEVLESSATCETTVEKCADCHQPLSNPKTDCR
jgi:hypothetical protein